MSFRPSASRGWVAAVGGWLSAAGLAGAALIVPASVSTDMGAGFATSLTETINGAGLPGGVPSLTAPHEATNPINSWVSNTGVLTGFVDFSLGGTFLVSGFSFWNQNDGGPGPLGSTGIRGVAVTYSLDGATYLPLSGAPTLFAQVPGAGPEAPETFSFAPVAASRIRFSIASNYGDSFQTGFAEAHFNGTPAAVPEPGSALAGVAALALCIGRRRAAR